MMTANSYKGESNRIKSFEIVSQPVRDLEWCYKDRIDGHQCTGHLKGKKEETLHKSPRLVFNAPRTGLLVTH